MQGRTEGHTHIGDPASMKDHTHTIEHAHRSDQAHMGDPLSDCSPLIGAAALGKLRLVRLLLEGGAPVNRRNPRGETPLLAACKALRGEPTGPETLRLLTYLLQNKADPNAQDGAGCTPLMYACMERAGAQVASALLAAGADPSMEDFSGASALVYAINAQHQPTLKVLMDACRANGRDIIIIATEMGVSGRPVTTRRYLNVPPSPDTSPVSCMSPSEILLKTGSPSSSKGENVFNFRESARRGSDGSKSSQCDPREASPSGFSRARMLSEALLAICNLARLHRAYERGERERRLQEEREGAASDKEKVRDGDYDDREEEVDQIKGTRSGALGNLFLSASSSRTERRPAAGPTHLGPEFQWSSVDRPPDRPLDLSPDRLPDRPTSRLGPHWQARSNMLPSLAVVAPPTLHLPPLPDRRPESPLLQVPAWGKSTPNCFGGGGQNSALQPPPSLPPLPLATSLVVPHGKGGVTGDARTPHPPGRRHSAQPEQLGGETGALRFPGPVRS